MEDLFDDVEETTENEHQDVVETQKGEQKEEKNEKWRDSFFKEKKAREDAESKSAKEIAKYKSALKELGYDEDVDKVLLDRKSAKTGQTVEEIKAEMEKYKAEGREEGKKEALKEFETKAIHERDLQSIKKAHPEVTATDISQLGSDFFTLMSTGKFDAVRAYEILNPPKAESKVVSTGSTSSKGTTDSEYYSEEELNSMTREQIRENFEKYEKSLRRRG